MIVMISNMHLSLCLVINEKASDIQNTIYKAKINLDAQLLREVCFRLLEFTVGSLVETSLKIELLI